MTRTLLDMQAPDNWFVAQLKPDGLARAQRNLARQGFVTCAPARLTTRRVAGSRKDCAEPLFPGYILVQFDPGNPAWRTINATLGVARILVSDPRHPMPLPVEFMTALMARCSPDATLIAPATLRPGDRVRILSGPFADLSSRVESLDATGRIALLLDLLGRAVRVKVDAAALERLGG